jgi:ligand-binding sensor domain-containing protein
MKILIGNILLVFCSIITSCNGQPKEEKKSAEVEKVLGVSKITMPQNGFSNGHVDKDGTIWFSSNGGGIFHYDGKTFKNYTIENGLSSNQVFSIVSDENDHLWFGTQNGVVKYDRKQFEHIPLPYQDTTKGWVAKVYPVINPNAAHALATDDNHHLWIGTAGGGAYQYDGQNFKSYLIEIGRKQEDSLYHNWVPFIRKDSKGNMWFASMTYGGVSKFDGSTFTQYLPEDGLSDAMVRTIFEDSKGIIWFGFNGNRNSGLTRFDGKSFETYFIEDGLCNKRIRAMYEDRQGNLWIGTDRGNLCVFDGEIFSTFNFGEQHISNVLFILGDLEDNIWFGGKDGIWKYDGQILTEIVTNK